MAGPKKDKTYKIVNLTAENVKMIKAVNITPDGNVVEITGENEQGKSSLLDSIFWGITGKNKKSQTSPIRAGTEQAKINLDLGSLVVKRTFTAKDDGDYTQSVIVESEEGARFQSPQAMLDALTGALSFDPLAFTKMKIGDQLEQLKSFVPDFDFAKDAAARLKDFNERTDVRRRLNDLKAQVAAIVIADETPDEEVDVSALATEINEISSFNNNIDMRSSNRERVRIDIERLGKEVTDLDDRAVLLRKQAQDLIKQAEDLGKQAQDKTAEAAELQNKLDAAGPLPEKKDVQSIRDKIDQAGAVNAAVREKKRKVELEAQVKKTEETVEALTKAIEDRDAAREKVIAAAKLPVDGITFSEDAVLLDGLPFDQASTARQIKTSVSLAIALNPRLRVIMIREGSLLDKNSFQIIAEMAEANDIQVWVETVDSNRPSAIVIEAGAVKS